MTTYMHHEFALVHGVGGCIYGRGFGFLTLGWNSVENSVERVVRIERKMSCESCDNDQLEFRGLGLDLKCPFCSCLNC